MLFLFLLENLAVFVNHPVDLILILYVYSGSSILSVAFVMNIHCGKLIILCRLCLGFYFSHISYLQTASCVFRLRVFSVLWVTLCGWKVGFYIWRVFSPRILTLFIVKSAWAIMHVHKSTVDLWAEWSVEGLLLRWIHAIWFTIVSADWFIVFILILFWISILRVKELIIRYKVCLWIQRSIQFFIILPIKHRASHVCGLVGGSS